MDPWYKIATPRKEVREGRSFNPDEFAIALEQVVAGNAPEDYRDPEKFFSRTCFTRALKITPGWFSSGCRARLKAPPRFRPSSRSLAVAKLTLSPAYIILLRTVKRRVGFRVSRT
jgi:hypothetical protein